MSQLPTSSALWATARGAVALDPFLVLGIVDLPAGATANGGEPFMGDRLLKKATEMAEAGAGMLDLGIPGHLPSPPVSEEEELDRVIPALRALVTHGGLPVSVNTRRSSVARVALEEGAAVIHDVSGLSFDPRLVEVVASSSAGLLLMHLTADPEGRLGGGYGDLLMEVVVELGEATQTAVDAGIDPSRIALDPGIGFGGSPGRSLASIREMGLLSEAGFPVVLGPTPEAAATAGAPAPGESLLAEAVVSALAWERGVRIFRVRHVEAVTRALTLVRQMVEDDPVAEAVQQAAAQMALGDAEPDPPARG